MAKYQASWKSALTPQKAPTYGNQAMLIASPKELQLSNVDYVVVFEGTKKYHLAIADIVNPYTLHVVIPEHDIAEEVLVKVYFCQDNNLNILTHLKFTYISQMEHAIAKFLAHCASDTEVADKLDTVWTVCLGKDHLELWDKRLAQAFAQLELPIEWTLVGDILQNENESHETLLHFAARHGLKELINVFLDLPGAKRALSTCNKSGLLPRDVARECERLDLVELLDADRSTEQRKSGTFKDSSRRKVRRNNDNGVTTITNFRNHNVHEDIHILRELNKLKAKRNSPVNRHSWPVRTQSFNPDEYVEDLEKELNKVFPHGDANDTKWSFIDENLMRLRDIREDVCNLRSRNAEEASKDISFIASQNRRPAHSRRLSCPASVERRKRGALGPPYLQSPPDSSASERSQGSQGEPANKIPPSAEVFSTPPLSPPVGQLIDLASPSVTGEDTFPPFDDVPEFLTPSSNTPSSSPLPQSPVPISLKYSDVEKRSNGARKSRPRTWYGGTAATASEEDEPFRRSNSLEDFAKALEEVSDDESDANSKENLLQTMSSLTEKVSRTESFVSSMSDLSVEKESAESDIECECGDDSDKGTRANINDITCEDVKDIEEREGIQEGGDPEGQQDDKQHKETKTENEFDNVEVYSRRCEDRDDEEQRDVDGEGIESRNHEEATEDKGKVDVNELQNFNQSAGSDENIENCKHESLEYASIGDEYRDTEVLTNENMDTNEYESVEKNEDTETATSTGVENILADQGKLEDRTDEVLSEHETNSGQSYEGEHQNCDKQQDTNELDTAVCNGVEDDVVKGKDPERDAHEDEDPQNEITDDVGEDLGEQDKLLNDSEDSKVNEEGENAEEPSLKLEETDVQNGTYADLEDSEITESLVKHTGIEENHLPLEDIIMVCSDEESGLTQSSTEDAVVKDNVPSNVAEDTPEENENASKETERQPDDSEDRTQETKDRLENSGDLPAESNDLPEESGSQANDLEVGTDDIEDKSEETDDNSSICQTKIDFQDIKDIECEVKDFCLPGENIEHNKELFRIQATDDVESGEDSDQGKHIRFDEKARSISPLMAEERSQKSNSEDTFSSGMFRQRSAVLLGVKTPVKRTGSDVSVTSLQDVQLDIHKASRCEDITTGVLNASRKAKSFGDLSTFSEGRSEMAKGDEDMTEDERRRIEEDQAQLSVLSRVKKIENASKYASNERLEQISKSRVILEREDEEQGRRRWSNFFTQKNPKPAKKPGRTPTFRRDNLRSSMSSIGKSSKNTGKNTIESLVMGQHAAAFAKHSQTAPNLHVTTTRPRSQTKDSPSSLRKSPTVSSIDSEEQKPDSPEEVEIPSEDLDLDVDSDLENFEQEPEAWSVTVERKMLKKMSKNEIKRQDVILELIQTEGHHVRTLKIMQQVFYRGLNKSANYPAERLDELFPRINDLVEISARFYRNLRCRQDEGAVVQKLGDVIVRQFTGDSGEQLRQAYGEFVSKHPEAVALYKHHFKTDKKFSNFIKKCHGHRIVRRLSVPECFTLVTQRMTKYPLLIEAILKVTKSSNADYKELQKALLVVKDATKSIDNAIKDYEKQSRLKDIKMRMEKGSAVLKTGYKIKNSRFVEYQSKMIHDGILQWRNARGKLTETHVVLLEAMVVFLQENDKKFTLLAIDGKSPCIALKTLMVREVATDKCAIYFVSTSRKGPEMYEFVCSSQKEKRQWYSIITEAIGKAPEETDDLFQSPEEEKRLAEERLKRRNEILEIMKEKDKGLADLVVQKNKLVAEMKELWQMPDGNGKKEDERIATNEKARSILLEAIHRSTQLTADTVLHESYSDSELAAATYDKKANSPKRAETFGGFDRRTSQKSLRRATATIPEGKSEETASLRRDSGLSLASESVVGLNTLSRGQEEAGSNSFQTLEALQFVLVQFSTQETALERLRVELQSTTEEIKKLRSLKIENDKKQLLMKEEHQAELTRQKKAYSDLERTFNAQVSELKTKLTSQQEQQEVLLQNFSELRRALTQNTSTR